LLHRGKKVATYAINGLSERGDHSMEMPTERRKNYDGIEVEILGETYEPGKPEPEGEGNWQRKLQTREEIEKYLRYAERYWYSTEWYGSEKRKTPA